MLVGLINLLFTCSLLVCPVLSTAVVKRSDDRPPLEATVQQLVSDLTAVQARLQTAEHELQLLKAKDGQQVAFHAYIQEVNIPETSGAVIRFSHTLTNVGNGYNHVSGAFTAPSDGNYMFVVSVDVSPDYAALTIQKNGHAFVSGNNDGGTDHHIVTTGIMTLHAGDTVTVNHAGEVKGRVDGGSEAVFVGFKLR